MCSIILWTFWFTLDRSLVEASWALFNLQDLNGSPIYFEAEAVEELQKALTAAFGTVID